MDGPPSVTVCSWSSDHGNGPADQAPCVSNMYICFIIISVHENLLLVFSFVYRGTVRVHVYNTRLIPLLIIHTCADDDILVQLLTVFEPIGIFFTAPCCRFLLYSCKPPGGMVTLRSQPCGICCWICCSCIFTHPSAPAPAPALCMYVSEAQIAIPLDLSSSSNRHETLCRVCEMFKSDIWIRWCRAPS